MHHCCLRQGLRVFFQLQPDCLIRQAFHQAQLHHLVSQQTQGPVVMAFGSVAARQGDQMGFTPIVQLAIPVGLGMVV